MPKVDSQPPGQEKNWDKFVARVHHASARRFDVHFAAAIVANHDNNALFPASCVSTFEHSSACTDCTFIMGPMAIRQAANCLFIKRQRNSQSLLMSTDYAARRPEFKLKLLLKQTSLSSAAPCCALHGIVRIRLTVPKVIVSKRDCCLNGRDKHADSPIAKNHYHGRQYTVAAQKILSESSHSLQASTFRLQTWCCRRSVLSLGHSRCS